jgi:N-hydroxyarylamine O-acetyltransferase
VTITDGFELKPYLDRIGVQKLSEDPIELLHAVHFGHVTSIPFENCDIFLGRPIRTDVPSVFTKLVRLRRGGYCFEHNTLLAAALGALGFDIRTLGARVGSGEPARLKRTHLVLLVEAGGVEFLADVGFGGDGLLLPMRMQDPAEVTQFSKTFRLTRAPRTVTLESRGPEGWRDLYQLTFDPFHASDIAVANHYTSTHPDSGFVRTMTVQRNAPEGTLILRNMKLVEHRDATETTTIVRGTDELLTLLTERFDLSFPPGTEFRAPR